MFAHHDVLHYRNSLGDIQASFKYMFDKCQSISVRDLNVILASYTRTTATSGFGSPITTWFLVVTPPPSPPSVHAQISEPTLHKLMKLMFIICVKLLRNHVYKFSTSQRNYVSMNCFVSGVNL